MKIFSNRGKDNKDKSLGLFHAEAAAVSAESAGCAFQSNSIIATGASDSSVALLSAVTNLVLSVLLIKVPSLVEGKTPMKRTVVLMALVNAFTWIPIIFTFIFFKHINPIMLIGLWILGIVPATLLGPLRDNWLANSVPSEKMGRYLSLRSIIGGIFYIAAFNIMGFTLNQTSKQIGVASVSKGFVIVLSVAFLASIASTFLYSSIRAPAAPAVKSPAAPPISFGSFLKGARKEHLGTFILFVSLFTFTVNLSSPLLAPYMMHYLKYSYMTFTLVISCEYVARVLSLNYWGKLVDKSGSLRVLGFASHLIPFVPILWLFSGSIFYLCIVQLFSGAVWAAFDLCAQTFIYKSTQPEQRLYYIVYYRSLTTFSAAMGTLTSALLLTSMFHVFGSQILGMLLLSGVLRMAVVRFMIPKLKPGGIPDAIVHEELARELAYVNYPIRQGLYYHPEAWARFTKPVAAFGNMIGQAVNKITPKPAGLYYNPQQWSSYTGQPSAVQVNNDETSKSGLYHNKKAWFDYMQQTSVLMESDSQPVREGLIRNPEAWASIANQMTQVDTNIPESSKSSRKGLLYDPEAWARMMNQAVKVDARMLEDLKPVRKGLLHDPEAWARFMNQTAIDEAKAFSSAKTQRSGIFYDSQKWGDYLKQSMVLNATTMRTGGDSPVTRQPIFYHPEMWGNYKNQSALSRKANFKAGVNVKSNRQPLLYHPEEWNQTFDPAMVHIGRKSAIGTVITRQSPVKNTNHPTVNRMAVTNRRITTSLSPA